MAITAYGFDGTATNPSLTEGKWSKLADYMGFLGNREGVGKGLAVSSAGTRTVSIASGDAIVPGVLVESTATESVTFTANSGSSARLDYLALDVNWSTNAAAFVAVTGASSAAPPSLTRTPGVRWQMPLALVTVPPSGTATIADAAPGQRRTYRMTAGWSAGQVLKDSSGKILTTITVPDRGWPYVLMLDAGLRASGDSGYAHLWVAVNGSVEAEGYSGGMTTSNGQQPVHASGATGTLTGSSSVILRLAPASMSIGPLSYNGGGMNQLTVLQIPA